MDTSGFRTLESQTVFRDSILGFRRDKVLTPDGAIIERKVVEYHPSSAIVPVKPEDGILLVRHVRHPVGRCIWDIPGGMRRAGESEVQCVERELMEETGYSVNTIRHLITFFPEPAFTDQVLSVYTGIIPEEGYSKDSRISEEEIRQVRIFGFDEIRGMIKSGDISSSWSIIGLLLTLEQY